MELGHRADPRHKLQCTRAKGFYSELCAGRRRHLRRTSSCIIQLKAHGSSRTCNESTEGEEKSSLDSISTCSWCRPLPRALWGWAFSYERGTPVESTSRFTNIAVQRCTWRARLSLSLALSLSLSRSLSLALFLSLALSITLSLFLSHTLSLALSRSLALSPHLERLACLPLEARVPLRILFPLRRLPRARLCLHPQPLRKRLYKRLKRL